MIIIEKSFDFGRNLATNQGVDGFVLHHTGDTDIDMSAESIHELHRGFGWAGIGYHFVFRKNGDIERGRPEWAQGAHCPGANSTRLGLHICGSFTDILPSEAQLTSLNEFLIEYCGKYALNPLDEKVITGHRDWLATACPGDMLYDHIPIIRQKAGGMAA